MPTYKIHILDHAQLRPHTRGRIMKETQLIEWICIIGILTIVGAIVIPLLHF